MGIKDEGDFKEKYYKAKLMLGIVVSKIFNIIILEDEELRSVWSMAESKTQIDPELETCLLDLSWHNLVPFLVKSKSPDILQYIVLKILALKSREYLLRMASENKFIDEHTRYALLDSSLPEKYKIKLR